MKDSTETSKTNKIRSHAILTAVFGRLFVTLLIASFILVGVIGLLLDAKGFVVNLIAGLCGIFLSIYFALFAVDRYLTFRKEQDWAKVNKITLDAIAIHLCEIIGALGIEFEINDYDFATPFFKYRDYPNPNTLSAFAPLKRALDNYTLPRSIATTARKSDIAIQFYERVMWDLDQIQNVLTPRVMQFSNDQHLIDALVAFDNARREWHHCIIEDKLVYNDVVYPNIPLLVQAAENVYRCIFKGYHGDS